MILAFVHSVILVYNGSPHVFSSPGFYYYGNNRGFSRGGYNRPGYGRPPRSGSSLKFEAEFDFETANAQFDKEEIERELKEKLTIGLFLNLIKIDYNFQVEINIVLYNWLLSSGSFDDFLHVTCQQFHIAHS